MSLVSQLEYDTQYSTFYYSGGFYQSAAQVISVLSAGGDCTSITLPLKRNDAGTGLWHVELYSGTTLIEGNLLGTSASIDSAVLSTGSFTWTEFTFPEAITLTAGNAYTIHFEPLLSTSAEVLLGESSTNRLDYSWAVHNDLGNPWSQYPTRDFAFTIEGTETPEISTPTLTYPTNALANVYLNTDHLMQFSWDDADWDLGLTELDDYTVWIYNTPLSQWTEITDRSQYSILGLYMYMPIKYEYGTTYSWFVRKTTDGVDYDSSVWTFTTTAFSPPTPSTDGGISTGENAMATIKRLVCAAANKIWYET